MGLAVPHHVGQASSLQQCCALTVLCLLGACRVRAQPVQWAACAALPLVRSELAAVRAESHEAALRCPKSVVRGLPAAKAVRGRCQNVVLGHCPSWKQGEQRRLSEHVQKSHLQTWRQGRQEANKEDATTREPAAAAGGFDLPSEGQEVRLVVGKAAKNEKHAEASLDREERADRFRHLASVVGKSHGGMLSAVHFDVHCNSRGFPHRDENAHCQRCWCISIRFTSVAR